MFNIIFVVETKEMTKSRKKKMSKRCNASACSDVSYVQKLMKHFFPEIEVRNQKYILMDGKANYDNPNIRKQISSAKSSFAAVNNYKTCIIYVFDKDKNYALAQQAIENQKITKHLEANGYNQIWFAPDIENVLLGRSSQNKTIDAAKYVICDEKNLKPKISKTTVTIFGSNFIIVLKTLIKEHSK